MPSGKRRCCCAIPPGGKWNPGIQVAAIYEPYSPCYNLAGAETAMHGFRALWTDPQPDPTNQFEFTVGRYSAYTNCAFQYFGVQSEYYWAGKVRVRFTVPAAILSAPAGGVAMEISISGGREDDGAYPASCAVCPYPSGYAGYPKYIYSGAVGSEIDRIWLETRCHDTAPVVAHTNTLNTQLGCCDGCPAADCRGGYYRSPAMSSCPNPLDSGCGPLASPAGKGVAPFGGSISHNHYPSTAVYQFDFVWEHGNPVDPVSWHILQPDSYYNRWGEKPRPDPIYYTVSASFTGIK